MKRPLQIPLILHPPFIYVMQIFSAKEKKFHCGSKHDDISMWCPKDTKVKIEKVEFFQNTGNNGCKSDDMTACISRRFFTVYTLKILRTLDHLNIINLLKKAIWFIFCRCSGNYCFITDICHDYFGLQELEFFTVTWSCFKGTMLQIFDDSEIKNS